MTKQKLYLRAIQLNPNKANAYNNLGTTLPTQGSIVIDGWKLSRNELHIVSERLSLGDSLITIKGAIGRLAQVNSFVRNSAREPLLPS